MVSCRALSLFSAALFTGSLLAPMVTAQQQMALLKEAAPLPDAPSAVLMAGTGEGGVSSSVPSGTVDLSLQGQSRTTTADPNSRVPADKYDRLILPYQQVDRLTGGQKVLYSVKEQFSLIQLPPIVVAASFSHLLDSAPHYGVDKTAFGQRVGAAAARQTIQTLTTDGVLAAAFHDDPRYYIMGKEGGGVVKRAIYAAERVVIARSDDGQHRVNYPLLLGYAVASAANNAYYPERDRKASTAAGGYAGSLAGAALGYEVREFFYDVVGLMHRNKN